MVSDELPILVGLQDRETWPHERGHRVEAHLRYDLEDFLACHPIGIEGSHQRADTGAGYHVGTHVMLLEEAEEPDIGDASCSSSAECYTKGGTTISPGSDVELLQELAQRGRYECGAGL